MLKVRILEFPICSSYDDFVSAEKILNSFVGRVEVVDVKVCSIYNQLVYTIIYRDE